MFSKPSQDSKQSPKTPYQIRDEAARTLSGISVAQVNEQTMAELTKTLRAATKEQKKSAPSKGNEGTPEINHAATRHVSSLTL